MAALSLKLSRLKEILVALAPVVGIDGVQQNVTISYDPQPTQQQLTAVQNAIAAFDWSDAADATWLENLNQERKTLRDQAITAINRLDNIINAANPTVVNLAALTQMANAIKDMALYEKHIIKRLIQID